MSSIITILGGRLYETGKRIIRREGTRRPSGQPIRPLPPAPNLSAVQVKGLQVGKVLGHSGNSRSAVYQIQLADGTIVTNKTPRRRGELAGPEFDIRPAANGTPCYYSIEDVGGQPTVIIHSCEEEIDSEACAALPGSGVPGSGVTAVEQANTPLRAPTKLVVSWTFNVTSLALDRKGLLLYSFPLGAIEIQSVVADLLISSSAVTNSIDVGMGTANADGGTGTGLSGTQQDVVAVTTPGAISAGGLDYERLMPSARDRAGSITVRRSATHTIGTSMGDVTWDTEVYKDSDLFTFSASSTDLTIVENGLYEISYDVTAEWVSTASPNAFAAQVVRDGSLITGTGGNDEVLGSSAGRGTISKRFTVALTAGDVIKLQVQRGAASTVRLLADGSNLTIRKLPVERNRGMLYDGTSAAKSLYLNIARTSASWDANGSVSVTGTIWLKWGSAGEIE